jgi:predicted nucleic acid-binding protein
MGLVLDSSVLIAAERNARPVSELLAMLEQDHGETEIVLSSITVIELEHGLHRANTAELARKRREYLDTVFAAIPVRAVHQGDSPGRGEDRRQRKTDRARHPIPGPANRRYRSTLRLRTRHPEPAPLSVDPRPASHRALAAPFLPLHFPRRTAGA